MGHRSRLFIAPVSGVTEAAATTSVLLRAAAGDRADWVKWIALSHESISDTLHKVCPQSLLFDQAKTDTGAGLQKALPTTLTISLFLLLALILSLTMLSLGLLFCEPLHSVCVSVCLP